jgi:hypothetical protein
VNISQAIQDVLALIQFAPSILQLIVQIEGVFGAGSGAMKKTIIMNSVAAAPPTVQSHVSNFIDATVKTMNEAGKFATSVQGTKAA